MTVGAPGTWDRDAYYALRAAGRLRRPFATPFRYGDAGGLLITTPRFHRRYGMSTSGQAYLVHEVASVHLAWRHGQVVAAGAYWRCRAFTMNFWLRSEPTATLCAACQVQRIPRPVKP